MLCGKFSNSVAFPAWYFVIGMERIYGERVVETRQYVISVTGGYGKYGRCSG